MLIDLVHCTVSRVAGYQAKNRPPDCLKQEQFGDLNDAHLAAIYAPARCNRDNNQKYDDSDPIVEQ